VAQTGQRQVALLITFFDIKATVHFKCILQRQTVNRAYYVEILKRLLEAVRRKSLELRSSNWVLHHNNDPAYKALSLKQFLTPPPQRLLYWNTYPVLLIWVGMTSGCFQK
jgi:hypothetical protein